jgi:hypothetical protein
MEKYTYRYYIVCLRKYYISGKQALMKRFFDLLKKLLNTMDKAKSFPQSPGENAGHMKAPS